MGDSSIPDPIELMELRIEQQCELVDSDLTYPCVECGARYSLENHDWVCMSPMGDGPLVCSACQEQGNDDG